MPHTRLPRIGRAAAAAVVALGATSTTAGARIHHSREPPATTATATPGRPPIRLRYAIEGSATVRTLTKGVLRLSGTADAALTLGTGAFTADLAFAESTSRFTALGILPVVATVQIVPLAPATGVISPTGLEADVRLRIKLPSVTLYGFPIGGGPDCETSRPAAVSLRSTAADQSPLEVITVASTFEIGPVTGCGPLTNLVTPLAAGGGNAIALRFTPIF